MFQVDDRVEVISNNTDEPELVGMTGTVARIEGGAIVLVFLDNDSMPTRFPARELAKVS